MKKSALLFGLLSATCFCVSGDLWARGGRGGARGGGRTASRPSASVGRSPSMSRPQSFNRPSSSGVNRPSTLPAASKPTPSQRPNFGSRPSTGGIASKPTTRPSVTGRPSTMPAKPTQRPSKDQLGDFLNIGSGLADRGRPTQLPAKGDVRDRVQSRPETRPSKDWQARRDQLQDRRKDLDGRLSDRRKDVANRRHDWADDIHGHWHDHLHDWHHHDCWDHHWWAVATWPAVAGWFPGWWSSPVYYDYGQGGNVYIQGDTYYVDGQAAGPTADYSDYLIDLAESGTKALDAAAAEQPDFKAKEEDWLALGVFGVSTSRDDTDPIHLLQLAVNKKGIISGTYFNTATEQTQPVQGSVDRKTQRAVFTLGDKKNTAVETGIFNLTKDETPVLVHFGREKVEEWLLVRLEEPHPSSQGSR